MTREEFIKQRCEIDKITLEKFKKQYRVIECNCGQPYCKGYRCLDLDDLLKENQKLKNQLEEVKKEYEVFQVKAIGIQIKLIDERDELSERLKKQLEECKDKINWYENFEINKTIDKLRLKHNTQQKEFIKYLEDEIKQNTPSLKWKHYNEDGFNDYDVENPSCIEVKPTDKVYKEILQKYKEIIGGNDVK